MYMDNKKETIKHVAAAVLLLCAITLGWFYHFAYRVETEVIGFDANVYLANGKSMVSEGTAAKFRNSYARWLAGDYETGYHNYPGRGFSLVTGIMGELSGQHTLLNAVWLNLFSCVISSLCLYFIFYRFSKSYLISFIFPLWLFLTQYPNYTILARPLTDMPFYCLFLLSLSAMVDKKYILAGIFLGIGFTFRAHALIFLPFLPLFTLEATNLKSYLRVAWRVCLPFVVIMILNQTAEIFLSATGNLKSDFYVRQFSSIISSWFTLDALKVFINIIINSFWPLIKPILLPLGFTIILLPQLFKKMERRYLVIAFVISFIPCYMWTYKGIAPIRYYCYSLPLFAMALVSMISRLPKKTIVFCCLLFFTTVYDGKGLYNLQIFTETKDVGLISTVQSIRERYLEPLKLQKYFPPGSVILSRHEIPFAALMNPTVIDLPDYDVFANSQGNERIDGILIYDAYRDGYERYKDWVRDEIVDAYGVRFERITDISVDNCIFYRNAGDR